MRQSNGKMRYGEIAGWGAYTPKKVLTNHDLPDHLETDHEWIVQRTGIHARHIAAADETTCTLALHASRAALAQANLTAKDLDLIIVATSTPDHHTPPVSSELQHALGADGVPALVMVTGCTGFVFGLSTAYQFIENGAYDRVLVVGVELLSRFVDWEDRSTCVLFGDAAGAVIVQTTDRPCGMASFVLGSDGSQGEHIIMPGGGSADPFSAEVLANRNHFIKMNGREVFKFATRVIGESCAQTLEKAGWDMDDVDWIIPHQANLRIIQAAAKSMNLPLERFIVNIDKYANTSAASIPLALTESIASGQIKPTDRLLFVSFGAGLTWGAMALQMQTA